MTTQAYYSTSSFLSAGRRRISEDLHSTIEQLRKELVEISATSDFTSEIVLELSQRLDKYIVLAQHQMKKEFDANLGI